MKPEKLGKWKYRSDDSLWVDRENECFFAWGRFFPATAVTQEDLLVFGRGAMTGCREW
ncbi:hypothetical protein KCP76_18675 [Salmonella enterica subsp. enterica serovar Weltevreden]|nr:hypothetical protein KCP76_18675 [Salmonella enterica subsp. enterica serovar Weltevreden]